MNSRKILIYNQYYLPLNNPPAKRLSGLAEYMANKGWDVTVVTGMPNYPDGVLKEGYHKVFKTETLNGIKVYRTYELPLKNAGFIKRLLNYLSFSLSSLITIPLIPFQDIILISTPPLISAVPYFYICALFRKKLVLDVRDLWPESVSEVTNLKKGSVYNMLLYITNDMYKKSSKVICLTNEMSKVLRSRGLTNIHVVTNFSKSKVDLNKLATKPTFNGKTVIVYTGIVTKIQNLEQYLKLNYNSKIKNKFEWHIVGGGEDLDGLIHLCRENGFDNVCFYGYMDGSFCKEEIKKADLCLAGLAETEITKMALPSKFIEYTSHGKPTVSNWSEELNYYVNKYQSGIHIDKFETDLISNILINLTKAVLEKMSENSLRLFQQEFSSEKVLEKYHKILAND